MDIGLILTIVCVVLLAVIVVLLIVGRKKSDIGEIATLLGKCEQNKNNMI